MKRHFLYITICLFSFIQFFSSCTDKDNLPEKADPGLYTVEKFIQIIKNETESRGIDEGNTEFDAIYDPDLIYLHIIGSNETVGIPLFTTNCGTNQECKCFRYNINVLENGDAIVTPFDNQGQPSSTSLRITNGSECYFSSISASVWELDEKTQIFPKSNPNHIFYKRVDEINKEIYRSAENFSIAGLINDVDDLIMDRACSAFTVLGLFYDGEEQDSKKNGLVTLNDEEFKTFMGSDYNQWYIKIYIGGKSMPSKFNLGTMVEENDANNYGYYSTGEFSAEFKNTKFVQLKNEYIGYGRYSYEGFGYYTPLDIRLLTPTIVNNMDIYILIKNWTGSGTPTDEWLASDEDALYTKLNISGFTQPQNGWFYTLGILLDIKKFSDIWKQKLEGKEITTTSSRSANGLHYFELKDAKVIFEKY